MQITVSDDLAVAARLDELSDQDARLAWIVGLYAERRLNLIQAARLAEWDEATFNCTWPRTALPQPLAN